MTITNNFEGERLTNVFDARDVPWRDIGTEVKGVNSSVDAITKAGLDWDVAQFPVYYDRDYNDFQPVDNSFVNLRTDTNEPLGIVTQRYQVVQNREAFQFTDSLIDTGQVHYESAGIYNGGKRIWLLAKLPAHYTLGDLMQYYLCFTHGHDGRHSIYVAITPVRVACLNVFTAAIKNAQRVWSTKHQGNMEDKLEEAKITLGMVDNYRDKLNQTAKQLYATKINKDKVMYLTEKLFPIEDDAPIRTENNATRQREDLLFRYNNAPDLYDLRGTAWGFVNAVSDFVTHAEPLRKTKTYKEGRFSSLVTGGTLIDDAIHLSMVA